MNFGDGGQELLQKEINTKKESEAKTAERAVGEWGRRRSCPPVVWRVLSWNTVVPRRFPEWTLLQTTWPLSRFIGVTHSARSSVPQHRKTQVTMEVPLPTARWRGST